MFTSTHTNGPIDPDDLPLSSFSPQGVKDAAKMDELVKQGLTPQDAAKKLSRSSQ